MAKSKVEPIPWAEKPPTTPWRAVILAVDPGKTSGFATFCCGNHINSGSCNPLQGAENACEHAAEIARVYDYPLVLVGEQWGKGGWTGQTMMGMGESWGIWKAHAVRSGLKLNRIVRVYPQTWRSQVFGGHRTSDEWKAKALDWAVGKFGEQVSGTDEAEALAIGYWGCYSVEVAKALPKRRLQ